MTSLKRWYLPILLLSLLLCGTLIFLLLTRSDQDTAPPASNPVGMEKCAVPLKNEAGQADKGPSLSFQAQQRLLSAPWGRDPFSLDSLKKRSGMANPEPGYSLRSPGGRMYDLKLTGIVFFDNQYMALINDTGVREGDTILGFKVLKIKRNYIVVTDSSGDYYTLELK